jgi:hypothetical protein
MKSKLIAMKLVGSDVIVKSKMMTTPMAMRMKMKMKMKMKVKVKMKMDVRLMLWPLLWLMTAKMDEQK